MKKLFKPSRYIGPEDVEPGQFVTIAETTVQVLPEGPGMGTGRIEPQSVTILPGCAGMAFEVIAVCYPFVLVRDRDGDRYGLDLRRHRLARLSKAYGKAAFAKAERPPEP
jgi:hypothetical protein